MKKHTKIITCLLTGMLGLIAASPTIAAPFTSWHATFVYFDKGQKDAQAMKDMFDAWKWTVEGDTKGWTTSIFPSSQVTDAFTWLQDQDGANEISIFYFAGHAFGEEADDNKIEESSTEDPRSSAMPNDEHDEGISTTSNNGFLDDQIGDELRKIAGFTVSVFDSCFSGGLVDGKNDINGKNQDGSNKKNEIIMMGSTEYEMSLVRDERGVFTEYLLNHFPLGDPAVEAFSTWFNTAGIQYLKDYKTNPASFNNSFQTFKLTQYADGTRTDTYNVPEPSTLVSLGIGCLAIFLPIERSTRRSRAQR